MMGLAVEDFEGHGDVWMEGRRAALLKVGAGRELQPIETRRRRIRLGHQRAQPAIGIRRSLPHELPAVARRIPLERDVDACGRHAAGNVENVGGNGAQGCEFIAGSRVRGFAVRRFAVRNNETKNADERQALARCSQELTESGG